MKKQIGGESMKKQIGKGRIVLRVLLGLLLSGALLVAAAVFVTGWLPVLRARKKLNGIEAHQKRIEQIAVPETVRIVALGEATHGNREFQELKKTVLAHLVETGGVRAFALEADFGEGLYIDAYIHGGDGTAEDAVRLLSYPIYHTESMVELVRWMRDYNDRASDAQKLSFYGIDLQNPPCSARYLIERTEDETAKEALLPLTEKKLSLSDPAVQNAFAAVKELQDTLSDPLAARAAENLMRCYEMYSTYGDDRGGLFAFRDRCMADTVAWIGEREAEKGNARILLAAHNDHIARNGFGGIDSMGSLLAERYGAAYMAIGTDYFRTDCNIPDGAGRKNHRFYSANPLAAQARLLADGRYYLDFADVTERDGDVYRAVHSAAAMGDLGEDRYTPLNGLLMLVYPKLTRRTAVPAKLYDAMILVDRATPLSLLDGK